MSSTLAGRVALISGGARGLGRAISAALVASGASVIAFDVDLPDDMTPHDHTVFERGDVRDADQWARLVSLAVDRFGSLDVLVNNAGVSSASEAGVLTSDGWDAIMSVNAKGALLGCAAAIAVMEPQGRGSIVNVASTGGVHPVPYGHVAYFAAKAALLSLSKSVAQRYGAVGIRSNAVLPGLMPPMRSARTTPGAKDRAPLLSRLPLGRVGEYAEIAHSVAFFASDESAYITGAELVVDGGMTI